MLITIKGKKSAYTVKDELLNTVNGLCYELNDNCLDELKTVVRKLTVPQARDVVYGVSFARISDHASTFAELLCDSLGIEYEPLA